MIQKKPTGLKIISRDVGPFETSAAEMSNGNRITDKAVIIEILIFRNKFIGPLFFLLYNE
tara:strand:+ start:127 stop:306 length:180 start_codon:yes stop_codon:yes gene_type:complete